MYRVAIMSRSPGAFFASGKARRGAQWRAPVPARFSFSSPFRSLPPVTAARTLPIACLLFLVVGAAGAGDSPDGHVSLAARTPVITLSPAPPGRHSLDLPSLEYALEVSAQCAGDGVPESLSINVADTRVTLSASELAPPGPRQLVLELPASQTAPLAVGEFCTAPPPAEPAAGPALFAPVDGPGPPSRLEVPGALSAQVSLVCRYGEERRMSWFSQPLGVTLACEADAPPPEAGPPPAGS